MNTRNGKIARRPRPARDELNEGLKDSQVFGNGDLDGKLIKYIIQVGNDVLGPKSVKPSRNRQTVEHTRKTSVRKVCKPLEESEMNTGKDVESSQTASNPVKLNQTDLAQQKDEGLATDELKKSLQEGSSIQSPTRPTRRTGPTRPPHLPRRESRGPGIATGDGVGGKGDAHGNN